MFRGSHRGNLVPLVFFLGSAPAAFAEEVISPEVTTERPAQYEPLLSFTIGKKWQLKVPFEAGIRTELASDVATDPDGGSLSTGGLNGLFRVGLSLDSRDAILPFLLLAEAEADIFTGTILGRTDREGVGLPGSDQAEIGLRKAYLRASLMQYLHLIGGAVTRHWGMGLVANDGTHGWEPSNAQFNDPRGGDRVIRAMLASGPHTKRHQIFAAVGVDVPADFPTYAYDDLGVNVPADDVSFEGDEAFQVVAALVYGRDKPNTAGVYFVRRHHEADSGGTVDVNVLDATAKVTLDLTDDLALKLEGEVAFIFGESTLAPSPEHPSHDVLQLGGAARATLDAGIAGGVIDFLYASGDADLDAGSRSTRTTRWGCCSIATCSQHRPVTARCARRTSTSSVCRRKTSSASPPAAARRARSRCSRSSSCARWTASRSTAARSSLGPRRRCSTRSTRSSPAARRGTSSMARLVTTSAPSSTSASDTGSSLPTPS